VDLEEALMEPFLPPGSGLHRCNFFNVRDNNLSGTIPSWVTDLDVLNLSRNRTRPIPTTVQDDSSDEIDPSSTG
jgi:hypothetical protein